MNKAINVQHEIWETHYKLTTHQDGSITVRCPVTHWKENSASLAFCLVRLKKDSREKEAVMKFFEKDTLVLDANNQVGALTLEQVLQGEMYPGVEVS